MINTHEPEGTPEPEKISVTVKKVWDDEDNADGIRPERITVSLYADGVRVGSKRLGDADAGEDPNVWTGIFTELESVMAEGEPIVYTVSELSVDGYETEITGDAKTGFTVTNTHEPEVVEPEIIEIAGTKTWNDEDDLDGIRPEKITLNLYADGEFKKSISVAADESGVWAYSFGEYPKTDETGKAIAYTITENNVEGYEATVNGFNVTNTHTAEHTDPEKMTISGAKVWDDQDNKDGIRPARITIRLQADGDVIGSKFVSEEDGWGFSFTGLDKTGPDGSETVYTVTEDEVPGYETAVTGNPKSGFIVTNTHTPEIVEPETIEIAGTKTWNDAGDADGIRPERITVVLRADEAFKASRVETADENGKWTYSFGEYPKTAEDGHTIAYAITENKVEGYEATVNGFNITNTHTPEQVEPEKTVVSGAKTWDDGNDADGIRPKRIIIRLLADGRRAGSKPVTREDGWSWSFTDLDKYNADGSEIVYTIEEDAVPDYETVVDGFNVTNTHTPEQVEPETVVVAGAKTWDDEDDADGIRPERITINLYTDGKWTANRVVTADTADENSRWTYSFGTFDRFAQDGSEISYTITENRVEGYETKVDGFDVTNTHIPAGPEEPDRTTVTVSKVWDDGDDADGLRPKRTVIRLLADGVRVGSKILSPDDASEDNSNTWTYTFTDLPVLSESGSAIAYTVEEISVKDYETQITGDMRSGFTVTNTHEPETIEPETVEIAGFKTWNDGDDADGIRPEQITVVLRANGTFMSSQAVNAKSADADGRWTYSFGTFPKEDTEGNTIAYTVSENAVPDYETVVNGFNITNTHTPQHVEPEKIVVSGAKTWDDGDNADGIRPKNITIHLQADGVSIGGKIVSEADGWSWTFTDLDKYGPEGEEIVYTITEDAVSGYETVVDGFNVTNTHEPETVEPETVEISGAKTWNDADDADGIRPERITVVLRADDVFKDSQVVTADSADENGRWTYSFGEYPKTAEDGHIIEYTVSENTVPDYTATVNGFDITNTHTPEQTEPDKITISGVKVWDDSSNADGIRPKRIVINLYADGKRAGSKTVYEEDGWSWIFTDLDRTNKDGTAIEYTIDEKEVAGYETVITGDMKKGFTVTNTHEAEIPDPEKIVVSGLKTWNDEDDLDGVRPEQITVNLLADGKWIDSRIVTEDSADENGRWAYSFGSRDRYASDGTEISYTITENEVPEYETTVNGFNVTNVHIPEIPEPDKMIITGVKTWDDGNNADGIRPKRIIVNVLADGVRAGSRIVTEESGWSYTFNDLDRFGKDGEEIEYTITENPVKGYETTVNGWNVTNRHVPETVDPEKVTVSGVKTWNDEDNADGIRPEQITLSLYADGRRKAGLVVTSEDVDENGRWAYSFGEFDRYASDGHAIEYTIRENEVAGYTTTITGWNVTNTHVPAEEEEKITISGAKTWDDGDDADGIRPEQITITLYADGKRIGRSYVTEADGWSWSFGEQDKFHADGTPVVYSIGENEVAGYETTISGFNVTNKHVPEGTPEPEKTSVTVRKVWDDENDADGTRPERVTINLYADGTRVGSLRLGADSAAGASGNVWTGTFADLDATSPDGTPVVYTVDENTVDGYDMDISGSAARGFVITNTHEPEVVPPEKISVAGTKVWDDEEDADGLRPERITVNLYADGVRVAGTFVTEADGWAFAFPDQNKYNEDGSEIVYTVDESKVEGYEAAVTGSAAEGFVITNKHEPENVESDTMDITVTKIWDDEDDADGIRPQRLTVTLTVDGGRRAGHVMSVADADSEQGANVWTYTFSDMERYGEDGSELVYEVSEGSVPDYEAEITGDAKDGFVITNTHVPEGFKQEYITIEGTKTWNDADDKDGIRPESITVNLKSGEETVDSTEVTAEGADANGRWTFAFENVPKYAEDGSRILYTVDEEAVEGYDLTVNGYHLTNTHVPEAVDSEKITVAGAKTWDDEDDKDGIRPARITVNLYADDVRIGSTYVNEKDGWSYSFEDLDKTAPDGHEIVYTVDENSVEGYEAEIDGYNITNKHEPEAVEIEMIEIAGTKTWNDRDDADGIRPERIRLHLLADGTEIADLTVTAESETTPGKWAYTFGEVPKYAEDGSLILYTVTESEVAGYETAVNGYSVTNTHIPEIEDDEMVTVAGAKFWEDSEDEDGIRPARITVRLYADGVRVDRRAVTEEDGWSWTFEDLPKYNEDGTEVQYTIDEVTVPGYTAEINGWNITNRHIPESKTYTIRIEGTKSWSDRGDYDGIRPDQITVNLLANGRPVDSRTVTAASADANGRWAFSFGDVPEYDTFGNKIEYTISESPVPGYTATYAGFDIINKHKPETLPDSDTVDIEVTKIWDDDHNADGLRPEMLFITLMSESDAGALILTADNAITDDVWTATASDFSRYDSFGRENTFSVSEPEIEGYKSTVTGNMYDGFVITNTRVKEDDPEKITVSGAKTWNDGDNKDNLRPERITVVLWADGVRKDSKVVTAESADADGRWTYSFGELPKYKADGTEISYTITENNVSGYTAVINGWDVTNIHVPESVDQETVTIAGAKTWDDENNADGSRPKQIRVNLYADGARVGSANVSEKDGWSWTFEGLDRFNEDGTEIVYTLTEDEVPGYETTIDGYNVTNSHEPVIEEPEMIEIKGTKTWNDEDDKDGIRPESITVNLFANGNPKDSTTVTADSADESGRWTYSFGELPKTDADGNDITYTVTEDEVPGYETIVTGLNLTNVHVPETVEPENIVIAGAKTWDDAEDADGLRPEGITVNLFADGVRKDVMLVTAEDGWSWSFGEYPKTDADGNEIEYTVTENTVPGYTAAVTGFNITNTHEPEVIPGPQSEKTDITVTKVWDDEDDKDGLRPERVTVYLLADGVRLGGTFLNEANEWTDTFTDLDVYSASGEPIEYTVTEKAVTGYEAVVTGDVKNGFVITNTHTPEPVETEMIEIAGTKTWNDEDDLDEIRPEQITVSLYADGSYVAELNVGPDSADETGRWTYSFGEKEKYASDGHAIAYTVTENKVPGYEAAINGFDITNTHVPEHIAPEKIVVAGAKTWDDGNNADGIRPARITVNLYADGVRIGSLPVTEEDGWSWSFTDLNKTASDGHTIEYTVDENEVADYETVVNGFNITNTHTVQTVEQEKITVSGTKTWDDEDDADGIRPERITVVLRADGEFAGSRTVKADEDGKWNYSFGEVPKFAEDGHVIEYTVTENKVEGYETTVNGFNITNTHTPEIIEPEKIVISGAKTWDDGNNADGIRPTRITVRILADGAVIGSKFVSEDEGWSWTFEDLDRYNADGTEIVYTIEEAEVPGYDTVVSGYNVTNTHVPAEVEPETIDVSGTLTWDDADDADGIRPERTTVNLYVNGKWTGSRVVTEDADGNWTYSFGILDKFAEDGSEIVYTVTENTVSGYETTVDGFDITNTHKPAGPEEPGKTTVTVSKVWDDADDADGIRPAQITIRLLADGIRAGGKIFSAADAAEDENVWTYTFTDLDVLNEDGNVIAYTVEEVEVSGYETSISGDMKTGFTVTNTHEPETLPPETVEIAGAKTWNDENDADGIRPAQITVVLRANGSYLDRRTVTAANADENGRWTYDFGTYPKYDESGAEIEYVVSENAVADYTATVNGFDITNTHTPQQTEPEKIVVTGAKVWNDENNADGIRPARITVTLYGDDVRLGSTFVSAEDGWSFSFNDLDKIGEGGEPIVYRIEEKEVPGYETEITGNVKTGFVITNTHEVETPDPEKVIVEGVKTWNDEDDADGIRPEQITVNLYADGSWVASLVVKEDSADENGRWAYSFGERERYNADGTEISYTITENEVPEYETTVNGWNITNVHIPQITPPDKIVISGVKIWDDGNDADGIRPKRVIIDVMANDVRAGSRIVSEETGWSYTFNDLDRTDKQGEEITYTIAERPVKGYESIVDGYNVTNKHVPETVPPTPSEKVDISGTKTWNDEDDADGLRPEQITLNLYANGSFVTNIKVTGDDADESGKWLYSFGTYDRYDENGNEIEYTVTEDNVAGYKAKVTGFNVTNTHTPKIPDIPDDEDEFISITVNKEWRDNNDAAGLRPGSVKVAIKANSTLVPGRVAYLSTGNNWTFTFTGLPKTVNGKAIMYLVEEAVPDHYEAMYAGAVRGSHNAQVVISEDNTADVTVINMLTKVPTITPTPTVITPTPSEITPTPSEITPTPSEITPTPSEITPTPSEITPTPSEITPTPSEITPTPSEVTPTPSEITPTPSEITPTPSEITPTPSEITPTPSEVTPTPSEDPTDPAVIEKLHISGRVVWEDEKDKDGIRPDNVTIYLLADGTTVGSKTVKPDNFDNWTFTFYDLDRYTTDPAPAGSSAEEAEVTKGTSGADKGREIEYTVAASPVADYTSEVKDFVVTYKHTPESGTDIPVNPEGNEQYLIIKGDIIWEDENNKDNTRPDKAIVKISRGEQVVQEIVVRPDLSGRWQYEFDKVPIYSGTGDSKQRLQYTLSQQTVEGYAWTTAFVSQNTVGDTLEMTTRITDILKKTSSSDDDDHSGTTDGDISSSTSTSGNSTGSSTNSINIGSSIGSGGSTFSNNAGNLSSSGSAGIAGSASGSISAGSTASSAAASHADGAEGGKSTASTRSESVKTGDETTVEVFLALAAISMAAMILLLMRRRRRG